jgi:hypothetical protein
MPRKYLISASSAFHLIDISAAIADYYGAGNYTIHYQDSANLIFSIPAISNKVIKITTAVPTFYFGDAWTSGTTITNQVKVSSFSFDWSSYREGMCLVLSSNYFLLCPTNGIVCYGILTNNAHVAFAATTLEAESTCYNLDDGTNIYPLTTSTSRTLSHIRTSDTGKILKHPLLFLDQYYNIIEESGSPVTIENLALCELGYCVCESSNVIIHAVVDVGFNRGLMAVGTYDLDFSLIAEIDNYTL